MGKEVELAIDYLRDGHKDIDGRVRTLEKTSAVGAEKFTTIFNVLDKIDKNVTWLVRLIIGSIIFALLAMLIKAGGG